MIGDGTYLMLNSEIVTAVAEGIKLTIVVFDNHGYQCIKDLAWVVRRAAVRQRAAVPRVRPRNRLTGAYVPVDFREARRGDGRPGPPGRTPRTSCARRWRRLAPATGSP